MKKSNYTVTMPLIDYEQFLEYKQKYEKIITDMKSCYDTNRFDLDGTIRFDIPKAVSMSKDLLNIKFKKAIIQW